MRDRRAVDEDQVELSLAQQPADRGRERARVEKARRRGDRRRERRDHPRPLDRRTHGRHVVLGAVRSDAFAFPRFGFRTCERGDRHLVRGREVPDHVERPDLPAALGRKGETMADVEDSHAVTRATLPRRASASSSAATSSGACPSRKIRHHTSRLSRASSRSVPSTRFACVRRDQRAHLRRIEQAARGNRFAPTAARA